jgi:hypothetical protein
VDHPVPVNPLLGRDESGGVRRSALPTVAEEAAMPSVIADITMSLDGL